MSYSQNNNSASPTSSNEVSRFIVIACAFLLSSSAAAHADMFEPPVIDQASKFTWSGAYVGAIGGYTWGKDATNETFGTLKFKYPYDLRGFTYGAKAGYNFDFNSIVVGVEGDFEGSSVTGGFYDPPVLPNPGGRGTDTTSWQGSLRGRLGLTADRYMVYGTGGYAFAQMTNSYNNPTSGITESFDRFRSGFTVGGGVDYAATDNIIVGAEFRHTQFSPVTHTSTTAFPTAIAEQAPTADVVRLSVSFKF